MIQGPGSEGQTLGLTAQQEVRRMTNLEGRRRSLEEAGRQDNTMQGQSHTPKS